MSGLQLSTARISTSNTSLSAVSGAAASAACTPVPAAGPAGPVPERDPRPGPRLLCSVWICCCEGVKRSSKRPVGEALVSCCTTSLMGPSGEDAAAELVDASGCCCCWAGGCCCWEEEEEEEEEVLSAALDMCRQLPVAPSRVVMVAVVLPQHETEARPARARSCAAAAGASAFARARCSATVARRRRADDSILVGLSRLLCAGFALSVLDGRRLRCRSELRVRRLCLQLYR